MTSWPRLCFLWVATLWLFIGLTSVRAATNQDPIDCADQLLENLPLGPMDPALFTQLVRGTAFRGFRLSGEPELGDVLTNSFQTDLHLPQEIAARLAWHEKRLNDPNLLPGTTLALKTGGTKRELDEFTAALAELRTPPGPFELRAIFYTGALALTTLNYLALNPAGTPVQNTALWLGLFGLNSLGVEGIVALVKKVSIEPEAYLIAHHRKTKRWEELQGAAEKLNEPAWIYLGTHSELDSPIEFEFDHPFSFKIPSARKAPPIPDRTLDIFGYWNPQAASPFTAYVLGTSSVPLKELLPPQSK